MRGENDMKIEDILKEHGFHEYSVEAEAIKDVIEFYESRICDNCKYYRDSCNICYILNLEYIEGNFGCNLFEKEEK